MTGGVDSQKFWEGPNLFTLNEQQHFVWDTASQKHKMTSYARNMATSMHMTGSLMLT